MPLQKNCKNCSKSFEVCAEDLKFYEKVSPIFNGVKYEIPSPTYCFDCRQQRRLSFRNERKFYHRICALSGKRIISTYSPDAPYTVYDQHVWWGDSWSGLDFGKTYDFSRGFFPQFQELLKAVPRISLINKDPENSEYCNFSFKNKNSYLLFTSAESEDCYYSNRIDRCKSCSDCSSIEFCELCYETIDSRNCYSSSWLQNCIDCSDCWYGYNLKGCKHCFGCANLTQARYCIFNEKVSKKEYEETISGYLADISNSLKRFESIKSQFRKYIDGVHIENCTGDALFNSKNALFCFEGKELQDCKYVFNATNMRDAYDVNNDDNSELVYEAVGSEENYLHCFNDICWFNSNLLYCSLCFHSKNLFGCVGLKRKEYCIFNKQYSKEEYNSLVPQIIEQMRTDNEWGEFFPMTLSPFCYNESLAYEIHQLNEEQCRQKGLGWTKFEVERRENSYRIPHLVKDVTDAILAEALICEESQRAYRITEQELAFYRIMNLPIPRKHPDVRHAHRIALRNPRALWQRYCEECGVKLTTAYDPNKPVRVFCEKCYLNKIY